MMMPFLQLDPQQNMPFLNMQELFQIIRDKTNADMRIIRDKDDVDEIQAASAEAKAAALKKEQDIAQQDADTRTFSALSNAANREGQAAGAEAQSQGNPGANRFAGLTLRR